jgi:hypothetical protein
MPSGNSSNTAQKNKNIVEKAKEKIDKYALQKAWRKTPWPEYVPPEARNSRIERTRSRSGSANGRVSSSNQSKSKIAVSNDAVSSSQTPSTVSFNRNALHHHNAGVVESSQSVTSFSSPQRLRPRGRSQDATREHTSTADVNTRVYGYIMGPPPIVSTLPATQHFPLSHHQHHGDDSATTITTSTLATGNGLGFAGNSQRKTINLNLQASPYVTLTARIVNNDYTVANTGLYFTKYNKNLQDDKEPQSPQSRFNRKKDENWLPKERALPQATSLAKYGQTGGDVTHGILVIRRNCSVSELIASAERQFGISGRISDICVATKKSYSKQVIAYSMVMRTLPDPPPIDEDCDVVIYLGGLFYEPGAISASFPMPYHHQSSCQSDNGHLSATRSAMAAMSSPMQWPSQTSPSPVTSPSVAQSPRLSNRSNKLDGKQDYALLPTQPIRDYRAHPEIHRNNSQEDRLFYESVNREVEAFDAFAHATVTPSNQYTTRPSQSMSGIHLEANEHAESQLREAQKQNETEDPQQAMGLRHIASLRNVHDVDKRHRFSNEGSFHLSRTASSHAANYQIGSYDSFNISKGQQSNKPVPLANENPRIQSVNASNNNLSQYRPPEENIYGYDPRLEMDAAVDNEDEAESERYRQLMEETYGVQERPLHSYLAEDSPLIQYTANESIERSAKQDPVLVPKVSEFDFAKFQNPRASEKATKSEATAFPNTAQSARIPIAGGNLPRSEPVTTTNGPMTAAELEPPRKEDNVETKVNAPLDALDNPIINANHLYAGLQENNYSSSQVRQDSGIEEDEEVVVLDDEEEEEEKVGSHLDDELARLERRYLRSLQIKPSTLRAKSYSAVAVNATPVVFNTSNLNNKRRTDLDRQPVPSSTVTRIPNKNKSQNDSTNDRGDESSRLTSPKRSVSRSVSPSNRSAKSVSSSSGNPLHHREFQHPTVKETPLSPSMQRSELAHRQRMAILRNHQQDAVQSTSDSQKSRFIATNRATEKPVEKIAEDDERGRRSSNSDAVSKSSPGPPVNDNAYGNKHFGSGNELSPNRSSNDVYSTKYSTAYDYDDYKDDAPDRDATATFHPVTEGRSEPSPHPLSDAEEESVATYASNNSLGLSNVAKAAPKSHRVASVRNMILDFKSLVSFK